MSTVLDSSFLIAFHNERDAHHERARAGMEALLAGEWGLCLLPEYVFLEVVTVLAMRRDLETATRVGDLLLDAREVELVLCSDHFTSAVATFRNPPADGLSFVDAAIVTIARASGAERVATFDRALRAVEGLAAVPE